MALVLVHGRPLAVAPKPMNEAGRGLGIGPNNRVLGSKGLPDEVLSGLLSRQGISSRHSERAGFLVIPAGPLSPGGRAARTAAAMPRSE